MRLERLEIQALPGIEPGFTLRGIGPGSNLVTGPNAVGKSSLIRAFRYLVGEARTDDPRAIVLTAVFQGTDARWTVRRTGREIVWEREGRPADRPLLPEHDQLHCTLLSMEDLLEADRRDDRLIDDLRRALSGGYDMVALRNEVPCHLTPRHGKSEARGLRKAEKTLREVEAGYEFLRQEEERIPSLEKAVQVAQDAAARTEKFRKALALLDVYEEKREMEAGLVVKFPDHMDMDKLHGNEVEQLERLDRKRKELHHELEDQTRKRENAEERLQETGLEGGRPEPRSLQTCDDDLKRGRLLEVKREQKQENLEKSDATVKQALGYLGGNQTSPRLDPDSVSRAETLAGRLQEAERKQRELQNHVEEGRQAPAQMDVDRHFRAVESLRAWLAGKAGISPRLRSAILVALAGGLLAGVTAGLEQAWLPVLGGALCLVGALWALFESRGADHTASRKRFESCGIKGPETWQRQAVESCLQAIETRRGELQQQTLRAQRAADARQELFRVEKELKSLQEEKDTMARELGFDPALTAAALDRFVRLVQDHEGACNDGETARAAITRLEGEIETCAGRARDFLIRWPDPPGEDEDLGGLAICLEGLRQRDTRAGNAQHDAREAGRELVRIKKSLAALDAEESTLFKEVGLEPGDRNELTRRSELFADWCVRQKKLSDARVLEAERRMAVEGEQTLLDRVEAGDRVGLLNDLEQAREQAGGLEKLQEDLTAIRTRLQDAGRDRRLENAMADVDAARAALEDKHQKALLAAAGSLLLDGVQQEHHSEHEPEVLRDARDRFRRFTHHAFELELDEKEGFIALDVNQQARRNLSELSSATRMQLLLAMRVAWTRHLEQGREALPLFLDEALTTSDEQRFNQVVESLEYLVQDEGRQIFYLSSRLHEVALWEKAAGNRPHHIDLAAVRFGRVDATPDEYALPEMETLPVPDGHSPESYAAALGVVPANPLRPPGEIHIYHLLRDDLRQLHDLLENWRINALGQLEILLQSSSAIHAVPDVDRRTYLKGRCGAARTWVDVWRQGRGKPLDRLALERSGAVTRKFIDPVSELADELHGDAEAVIRALHDRKVPGFHKKNKTKLADWLETEGYLDPDEVLDAEERERRTLQDAAGHAPPEEIRRVVRWLEGGAAGNLTAYPGGGMEKAGRGGPAGFHG